MKLRKIIGKKLKAIRLGSEMTIQDLASRSGVSSNMISRVERGLTIPSVEILMKLARVFEKSIDYFVEEVKTTHEVVFTSSGQRDTTIYENNSNMLTESFTSGLRDPQFTSFYCTIPKGGKSGDDNMYHPGDELIFLLEGCLQVTIIDDLYVLNPGDSLSFKSHLPHQWKNIGPAEARVIWTLSPFTVI
ncbi:helix-turn-helix domain-containing protein [Desulfuromonas thiophila]|mgnify:CR=1 FL=1|uniref:Transcriptional regulator, XRE family with cupin sensor n=1 Tax=Desulfuromonas thiophila TaxID=57664 RepID=A0A1G7B602_9BACT|nr:XRE family transcriptional regulator [Desulfuromonas thiophila]MCK9173255.1 XRE family transcriptional regulator [Desulfuromonas thiophila]MDD3802125.1 XRE family transcriptional regulator [Desulfuromonas thiophila]SDE22558.1 transcriptional regulator, XRE family with cupin sensor [Desulfuromonas thiophila]